MFTVSRTCCFWVEMHPGNCLRIVVTVPSTGRVLDNVTVSRACWFWMEIHSS